MSKEALKKGVKSVLFVGGSFNPANYVVPFFRYRPTGNAGFTKNILNGIDPRKMFTKKARKELYDALVSVESKHTFEKKMQVEGHDEEDLKKGHGRYQLFMIVLITILPMPIIYQFFNLLHEIGDVSKFAIFQTIFYLTVPLLFMTYFYLYYAWLTLRIRNKILFSPMQFYEACRNDLSNLSPLEEYTTKIKDKEKTKKLNSK
jgi:hypothetical protein